MAVHHLCQYFQTGMPHRQRELDRCLLENIANPHIHRVHLLLESDEVTLPAQSEKIVRHCVGERLKWNVLFDYVRRFIPADDVVIAANADIFFDESLATIEAELWHREVFALLRYAVLADGTVELFGTNPYNPMFHPNILFGASQDAWIFRAPLPPIDPDCDFFIGGVPLCDSKINWIFQVSGVEVFNPCLNYRALHLHAFTSPRGYKDSKDVPPPPYATPRVCCLNRIEPAP